MNWTSELADIIALASSDSSESPQEETLLAGFRLKKPLRPSSRPMSGAFVAAVDRCLVGGCLLGCHPRSASHAAGSCFRHFLAAENYPDVSSRMPFFVGSS